MKANVEVVRGGVAATLSGFSAFVFKATHPPKSYIQNWHIELVCSALEYQLSGDFPKGAISLPPRTFKTFLCSIAYPLFAALTKPGIAVRVSVASPAHRVDIVHQLDFALNSRLVTLYPRLKVVRSKGGFHLANGSTIRVGVFGQPMDSAGFDLWVIDDPESESTGTQQDQIFAQRYLERSLATRRNDANSRVLLVQHRVSGDDLTAFVRRMLAWEHLSLPALANEDRYWELDGITYGYKRGEPLLPQLLTGKQFTKLVTDLGVDVVHTQYQQLMRTEFTASDIAFANWLAAKPQSPPHFDPQAPPPPLPDWFGEAPTNSSDKPK